MVVKTALVLCITNLFIQSITAYVCSDPVEPYRPSYPGINPSFSHPRITPSSLSYPGTNPSLSHPGINPSSLAASNGGGFTVTSSSPITPTGVTMKSDNAYEGAIAIDGEVPFLGAIALDGALPTGGSGGVSYGCGNGNSAILYESLGGNSVGYGKGLNYVPVLNEGRIC